MSDPTEPAPPSWADPRWSGRPNDQAPSWPGQPGYGQALPQYAGYRPEPASTPMAIAAAVVLLVFGGLVTLIGFALLAFSSMDAEFLDGFADGAGMAGGGSAIGPVLIVASVIMLVVGVLHLTSAIGVLAHREWGRWIGLAVAALGLAFGLLSLLGSVGFDSTSLVVSLVWLAGYGTALGGLIVSGAHFRSRLPGVY